MLVKRSIQEFVEKALFKRKIIIIYGARQVGKTTLVKEILQKYPDKSAYFNCDESDIKQALTNKTSTELKSFLGNQRLIVFDEAQRVENIGLTLKLLADNFPEIQIIATGSSSFDLSNKVSEPLTGRKNEFFLFPLSLEELSQAYTDIDLDRLLKKRIILGMYPAIVFSENDVEKTLKSLAQSYLYKDALQFQDIRNPEALEKLVQALALQVGNEVSYNELADLVGINKNTIMKYIRLLEQAFIIFRLTPFSKNLRNELKKLRKIYFFDTGIRNAVINNLNPPNLRTDIGSLWENFLISERVKRNLNHGLGNRNYFWRTREGQEIDYIEDANGRISGFEIKWQKGKLKKYKNFTENYRGSRLSLINQNNYKDFLIKNGD